jgi:plastocyanin/N-acetylneuraminic acid mutarotase
MRSRTVMILAAASLVAALFAGLAVLVWPAVRSDAAGATHGVEASNTGMVNFFSPQVVNISLGDTVQWHFTGGNLHDIRRSTEPEKFDSGYTMPGGTPFSHTFNTVGSFAYVCSLHSEMAGTVNVSAATSTATVPATETPIATPTPESAGAWIETEAMTSARRDPPIALLTDGHVIAIGGDVEGSGASSVENYDPETNAWSAGIDTGTARMSHSATTLLSGDVLIAGGESSPGQIVGSAQRLDRQQGNWGSVGAMGLVRRDHSATLLQDGNVLVAGGETKVFNTISVTASAEVYDAASDAWSGVDAMGAPRIGHAAVRLLDGRVLVIGGYDGASALASAEAFDPGTGAWNSVEPMPEARSGHTAVLLDDGRVLVAGGDDGAGGAALTGALIYDPPSDAWSSVDDMHTGRARHVAVMLDDGRVLVAGGDDGGVATSTAEIFDPAAGTWQTAEPMHAARTGHSGLRLLDGRVIVVGGSEDVAAADAEIYAAGAMDDGDGVPADVDNCPAVFNPSQTNTDADAIPVASGPADASRPHADALGDACDADDDNDGLPDDVESAMAPGGAYHGDCPSATGDTDPLEMDSDGDRTIDGAECMLGGDPSVAGPIAIGTDTDFDGVPDGLEAALGSNPDATDSDSDGALDGIEVRGYGTAPVIGDSDGDGCSDGREIASVDGVSAVNSLDLQLVAQRFGRTDRPVHDVNKSGAINALDLQLIARNFSPSAC